MLKILGKMGMGTMLGHNHCYLDSIISSAVLDLDATIAASYGGSGQTWANLTGSPASGDAKTAYDMHFGSGNTSDTDDPTFTGSAGSKTAYMSFDGGDYFTLKSGANTDFINNLHKTTGGQDFWIAVCGRLVDSATGQVFVGNQTTSGSVGVSANFGTADKFRLQQRGDSTEQQVDSLDTYTTGLDFCAIYSHDHATNTTRIWVNGVLTELSHTFDTTTSNASSTLHIGGHGDEVNAFVANGTRIYGVAMGNEYLTPAQEALIRAHYETRHNRSYTDIDVDTFDFADSADQDQDTLITSDIVQVKGFTGPETVTISGDGSPAYRLCEDGSCSVVLTDWTTGSTVVDRGSNKLYAQLRLTSASAESTTRTATLTFGDEVVDWDVTTAAAGASWVADISTASYDSVFYDPSEVSVATGQWFNDTGTKMYLLDNTGVVYQYTLSTAWDVSTASYDSKSYSTATETDNATGVVFGDAGSKMYVADLTADAVFQYTLSTPYDVSTASYASKSLDVSAEEGSIRDLWINPDGDKLFIVGNAADVVASYDLSTAWDVSTGTVDTTFSIATQAGGSQGLALNPQGTKIYVVDAATDTIYQYGMSTAFDLSTASYDSKSFSVSSQETTPLSVSFKSDDGTKFFITGSVTTQILRYSVTAS